jgi:hypothetical protein
VACLEAAESEEGKSKCKKPKEEDSEDEVAGDEVSGFGKRLVEKFRACRKENNRTECKAMGLKLGALLGLRKGDSWNNARMSRINDAVKAFVGCTKEHECVDTEPGTGCYRKCLAVAKNVFKEELGGGDEELEDGELEEKIKNRFKQTMLNATKKVLAHFDLNGVNLDDVNKDMLQKIIAQIKKVLGSKIKDIKARGKGDHGKDEEGVSITLEIETEDVDASTELSADLDNDSADVVAAVEVAVNEAMRRRRRRRVLRAQSGENFVQDSSFSQDKVEVTEGEDDGPTPTQTKAPTSSPAETTRGGGSSGVANHPQTFLFAVVFGTIASLLAL